MRCNLYLLISGDPSILINFLNAYFKKDNISLLNVLKTSTNYLYRAGGSIYISVSLAHQRNSQKLSSNDNSFYVSLSISQVSYIESFSTIRKKKRKAYVWEQDIDLDRKERCPACGFGCTQGPVGKCSDESLSRFRLLASFTVMYGPHSQGCLLCIRDPN